MFASETPIKLLEAITFDLAVSQHTAESQSRARLCGVDQFHNYIVFGTSAGPFGARQACGALVCRPWTIIMNYDASTLSL